MSAAEKFLKRPIIVEALPWMEYNLAELQEFAGEDFQIIPEEDRGFCDDPEATAQVRDHLHGTWVLVYTEDWIIKGPKGELYPCRDAVFHEIYMSVDDIPPPGAHENRFGKWCYCSDSESHKW